METSMAIQLSVLLFALILVAFGRLADNEIVMGIGGILGIMAAGIV